VLNPQQNCQFISPVLPHGECNRGVAWTWEDHSTFCQITLVFVKIEVGLVLEVL